MYKLGERRPAEPRCYQRRHPMQTMVGSQVPVPVSDETWEYTYYEVEIGNMKREIHTINQAGSEGWEIVSTTALALGGHFKDAALTTTLLLLFKRRRQPSR